MPTLADIYSAIDSAKRKGSDFVRNPGASLQQMVGLANDRAGALNELTSQAAMEGGRYGPKSQQLANQMAEGYNPAGITVDKLRIYRGSHVKNPEYSVVDNYKNDTYGGVFGSSDLGAAMSHGTGGVHFTDIPKNKILTHYDLNYQIPYKKTKNALLKARPDLKKNSELFDELYDIVVGDAGQDLRKISDDKIYDLFRKFGGDADNEAQRLRGQVSKNLGYKAVEMTDEHGTGSYLVSPGAVFKSVD